jgi:hypothetical protein
MTKEFTMSEYAYIKVSFRNEGVIRGALNIVITANLKTPICGVEVTDKYRIICWSRKGKTYFNLDIVLTSLELPHSQLYLSREEVVFNKDNLDYFIKKSDSVRFQKLPYFLQKYLRENLFYIMKEAPEETVAK